MGSDVSCSTWNNAQVLTQRCSTWNTAALSLVFLNPQNTMLGARDAYTPSSNCPALGSHSNKPAARGNPRTSFSQRSAHVVDGTQGNHIEAAVRRHRFDPSAPHLSVRFQNANSLPQECSLLALRLCQGHPDLRQQQMNGQTRKSCPGSIVEQSRSIHQALRHNVASKQAFTEVPLDDLFGRTDCCQIRTCVPEEQQIQVCL